MSTISVDYGALEKSRDNHVAYLKKLLAEQTEIDTLASELSGTWRGPASTTYLGQLEVKQDTLTNIIAGMNDIIQYESKAVKLYADADKTAGQMTDFVDWTK